MSNFPTFFDGQTLKQTTRQSIFIPSFTYRFLSMKQQRFVSGVPVSRFDGTFSTLFTLDYIGGGPTRSLQDFHDAVQGRFGQFTLSFNGSSYSNCYMDIDRIDFQEKSVNLYSSTVKIKQFPATGFPSITVSDPVLPTLGNGTTGPQNQYPNKLSHSQSTVAVDLPDDQARYAYHRINSPIPSGSLDLKLITTAEAAIMSNFFIQLGGMYGIFTLVYNSISYVNCHFTSPELIIDYSQGPNAVSMSLPWEAIPS